MKVTIFTSNQPRHISLIKNFLEIGAEVCCVIECTTVFPGQQEGFYSKTEVMQQYFYQMMAVEKKIFGDIGFLKGNLKIIPLAMKDVSSVPLHSIKESLDADYYIVFGASWIRGQLIDYLIERKAINIHMGVSPYYRGTVCNFWAHHDGNPHMIGATIHLISKGLDSGDMLYHALPCAKMEDRFATGMRAVKAAHISLRNLISENKLFDLNILKQDKSKEIRYSRKDEFGDELAKDFLERKLDEQEIYNQCVNRDLTLFHNPIVVDV